MPRRSPIYRQVADDDDLPQPYRDLALIRQTALEYDKLPPAAVIDAAEAARGAGQSLVRKRRRDGRASPI